MKRTPLKRKRKTPRRSGRVRDDIYLDWIREQPCCARMAWPCSGPIEADHAGRRPLGRKCDDREAIPLCQQHHRERTDMSGRFAKVTKDAMRAWLDDQIKRTQARWAGMVAEDAAADERHLNKMEW